MAHPLYVDPVDGSSLIAEGSELRSVTGKVYRDFGGGWDLRPGADAEKAFQADIYDQMLGELTTFEHPHNLTLVHQKSLLDRLELKAGDRVLEIGGHRSGTLPYLEKRHGIIGSGLDISPVWVKAHNALAKARVATAGGGTTGSGAAPVATEWVLGDAEHLPFAEGAFAAVVAFDVFEHLTNLDDALRGVFRVLRPGGMLVCHMPVRDIGGSFDGFQRRRNAADFAARQASVGHFHERMPTRREMRVRLEGAGLDVLDTLSFNVWFQPLHDHRLMAKLGKMRHRGKGTQERAPGARLPRQTASNFQKFYSAVGIPIARMLTAADAIGVALEIGGSCSFVARRRG